MTGARLGEPTYIEMVVDDPKLAVAALEAAHGIPFSPPVEVFGHARVATLASGTRLAVRAPLSADERPVTRCYLRVADLDAAVDRARRAGADVMLAEMALPGHGRIAIVGLAGVEHGLWEIPQGRPGAG